MCSSCTNEYLRRTRVPDWRRNVLEDVERRGHVAAKEIA